MQFAAFTKPTFLTVSFWEFFPSPSPPRLAVRPLRYLQSRKRWSGFTESGMASRTSGSRTSAKYQLAILERQKQLGLCARLHGLGAKPAHERRITLGLSRRHHPGVV
jgi:hypothetical protein